MDAGSLKSIRVSAAGRRHAAEVLGQLKCLYKKQLVTITSTDLSRRNLRARRDSVVKSNPLQFIKDLQPLLFQLFDFRSEPGQFLVQLLGLFRFGDLQ